MLKANNFLFFPINLNNIRKGVGEMTHLLDEKTFRIFFFSTKFKCVAPSYFKGFSHSCFSFSGQDPNQWIWIINLAVCEINEMFLGSGCFHKFGCVKLTNLDPFHSVNPYGSYFDVPIPSIYVYKFMGLDLITVLKSKLYWA